MFGRATIRLGIGPHSSLIDSLSLFCRPVVSAEMFPKILSRVVKDKVGNSKVIQAFKDTYDYIIGKQHMEYRVSSTLLCICWL